LWYESPRGQVDIKCTQIASAFILMGAFTEKKACDFDEFPGLTSQPISTITICGDRARKKQ
jgi:hypothetical protein